MKLFIDDIRKCPDGYILAKTYEEAIRLISKHAANITEISLDHDLGEEKTGYDIACFIESTAYSGDLPYKKDLVLKTHSANPVGVKNINMAFDSIRKIL